MKWKCPKCSHPPIEVLIFPVHCSCGNTQKDEKVEEELSWQEMICENCPTYMGNQRCRLIDLGCRKSYKRELRKLKCPRKKWIKPVAPRERWSYGVTTVPARIDDGLLKRTIDSLALAGFASPRIFIDGLMPKSDPKWLDEYIVVERGENLRTFGNWVMTAWEIYIRNPLADFFAIFQDDFVAVRNLRQYIEASKFPAKGYLNLYTFPQNEQPKKGFYQTANQKGLGAVALIFSNEGLRTCLGSGHMINRPQNKNRGWRAVDGGIVTGMNKEGWKEFVHNPSLVQHTGDKSSMGNRAHEKASTFPGEDFDAMGLLAPVESVEANVEPDKLRIGLVGYHAASGLGEVNRQIAEYIGISTWLVRPHRNQARGKPEVPGVEVLMGDVSNARLVNAFLSKVDVVVFAETEYFPGLIKEAKRRGKRIVCVPMIEWTPVGGWTKDINLFVCPTGQSYLSLHKELPCASFAWPFDTSRFQFRQRSLCQRFLFINGNGGVGGRKGAAVVQEAKRLWPEMPLVVRSQKPLDWPAGTEVLPPVKENSDLYSEGDVLLMPHSVDGIGLELMEAMASGMPVVATDAPPWNEYPLLRSISTDIAPKKIKRTIPWCSPSPQDLVRICKELVGQDISYSSSECRKFAEENRWQGRAEEFTGLVRDGTHRVALPFTPGAAHHASKREKSRRSVSV